MMEMYLQDDALLFGLVIEANARFELWHERLLKEVQAIPGVQLASVALDPATRPPAFESALASAAYRFDNFLTTRRGAAPRPDWQHAGVETPELGPDQTLDVVVDLRAQPGMRCGGSEAAREVWSVDFLRGPNSPEQLGMHVAVAGYGAFPIALEQATEGGFQPIDHAVCAGRPSAARNLEQAQQVTIAMILRTLRARIAGARQRPADAEQTGLQIQDTALSQKVGSEQAIRFAGNFVSYAAARSADSLSKRISAWSGTLAPHFRLHHAKGSPLDFSLDESTALRSSRKHYLADPFLFRDGGKLWVFFELFDYASDTGSIAVAELTPKGLGPIETVLTGNGHLSYPHVFAHGGEIYMMPECCARQCIEVWRAVRFPYEWELVSTALEGALAVDSNLYHDGDKWWLFANVAFDAESDAGLELRVYEADGPLLKGLTPQARNPVVADARFARNGGRVFWRDGKLYRPAQSLEYGQYGYGLYIMEILRLSHEDYEERPVRFIKGCHHMDSNGSDIIFDMRRGATVQLPAAPEPPFR